MKSKRSALVLIAVAVIALVAVAVMMVIGFQRSGLVNSTASEGHDTHLETDPVSEDAEIAAKAAMTGLLTWNPAEQDSPQAAAENISDQLAGQLHDYAVSGQPDSVLPDEWESWSNNKDMVHAVATVDQSSPEVRESDTQVTVTVTVEQTVWHSTGAKTPYRKGTVEVGVTKEGEAWKASDYRFTEIDY